MRILAAIGLFGIALAAPVASAQEIANHATTHEENTHYESWPLLRPTFPSTGGNGIMIKGYDPVISSGKCRTTFMAVEPGDNPNVYPNYIEYEAVPAQGGTLCQNGQWRSFDGADAGTTTFRIFAKDGVLRGFPLPAQ